MAVPVLLALRQAVVQKRVRLTPADSVWAFMEAMAEPAVGVTVWAIWQVGGELLTDVELFEFYAGEPLPERRGGHAPPAAHCPHRRTSDGCRPAGG